MDEMKVATDLRGREGVTDWWEGGDGERVRMTSSLQAQRTMGERERGARDAAECDVTRRVPKGANDGAPRHKESPGRTWQFAGRTGGRWQSG